MRSALLTLLVFFFFCFYLVHGQTAPGNRDQYRIAVSRTDDKILIDGLLTEPVWSRAEKANNFHKILPIDTGYAQAQTEVMITYDELNLFMGIICYDTLPGKRPVESLRRDFSFGKNDNFIAFIDTYNDQTNGFAFGISAAGAQWDGLQANGGFVSLDWDCKWRSAVKNYPGFWVAEFSIPFRSIRYREGDQKWGINFSRLDLKTNEKSSWAPVPRQFQSANLAYTGSLVWDQPMPPSGVRSSLIPYLSGKVTHQKEAGEEADFAGGAGLDAKVILSSSMNLDVTINPDYSQVEVDQQRTNLDRFELYFPEKRKFFLENSDLFASLGIENNRPFFSRRIGLDAPVLGGARLSGTVGESWRMGLMNMQTGRKGSNPATNYSVAVLQRKILSRSNVGLFMTNKQLIEKTADTAFQSHLYNRMAGAEFNFFSTDNKLTGKAFYHHSFYQGSGSDRASAAALVTYETQQFKAGWTHVFVGGNYLAEMGFIRRKGYHQMNPVIEYKFFPVSKRIANHGPEITVDLFFDPEFSLSDRETEIGYSLEWMNRSKISLEFEEGYVRLLEPFDPTNTGGAMIPEGSEFRWRE